MRRAYFLCAKDLRQRVRDRTALTVGIVAPLVLIGIIGAALGGPSGGARTTLVFVDLARSPASAALARSITEEWPAANTQITWLATVEEADAAVAADRAAASIVVPADFGRPGLGGASPPRLRVRTARTAALGGRIATALAERAGSVSTARVELRPPQGRLRPIDHYGPSLTVLFLFFQLLGGMRAYGAEAETGTLARLAATPATARDVLVGKLSALTLVGGLQFAVLYAASRVLFGVAWGPPLLVAALATATIASALGLMGCVIAAGGPYRGYLLGTLLLFVLSLLGGQFLPPEGLPDAFDTLARCTPNGQALRGFTDLAAAGTSATVATIAEPLLFNAVVGCLGLTYCARKLGAGAVPVA